MEDLLIFAFILIIGLVIILVMPRAWMALLAAAVFAAIPGYIYNENRKLLALDRDRDWALEQAFLWVVLFSIGCALFVRLGYLALKKIRKPPTTSGPGDPTAA